MKICGNIFGTDNYDYFALRCVMCTESFGQWTTFIKHLQNRHAKNGSCKDKTNTDDDDQYKPWNDEIQKQEKDEEIEADFLQYETIEPAIKSESEAEMEMESVEDFVIKPKIDSDECGNDNKSDVEQNIEKLEDSSNASFSDCTTFDDDFDAPKLFRFDLHDTKMKKISLQFLKLLKRNRILWDKSHKDHGKRYLKTKAVIDIRTSLQKLGYSANDAAIRRYIQSILNDFSKAQQQCLDERMEYLLNKCKFLDTTSNDDNTVALADEQQAKEDVDMSGRANSSDDDDDDSNYEDDEGTTQHSNRHDLTQEIATSFAFKLRRSYKRIRFHVPDNKIAVEFIRLVQANPVLWDVERPDYNNKNDRKEIMESWIPRFKELHNIDLNYDDVSLNLQNLRRYRNNLANRKELDEAAKVICELCSFFPKRKRSGRVKCDHCDSFFLTDRNYQAHLYAAHQIGESPYKCEDCDKSFSTAHQRTAHVRQVHVRKFDFPCSFCELRFLQRSNLQMHMGVHTGEKKFICETCGQAFRRRVNLKNHEIRIHLRQRNFHCEMCPKSFYTKALLKDHVNAHLNIRNFKCPFCGKGFHSSHALMRHKQIHSEVKKYACKLCDARFHQFVGLNSHMKNRHKYVSAKNENGSEEEDDAMHNGGADSTRQEDAIEMLDDYVATN